MKNLLKPYSLLLYFLAIVAFFFVGASIAGVLGAGRNQGLAGGAIVFGYGVMTSFFAFIAALFICYTYSKKFINTISKLLAIIILVFLSYLTWSYYTNLKPKIEQQKKEVQAKPTKTVSPNI